MQQYTEYTKAQIPQWYVIQTLTNYEDKVKEKIEMIIKNNENYKGLILQAEVPTEQKIIKKGTQKKVINQKVFPGYVFVKMVMNSHTWYVIRNIRGVKGFVGAGKEPVPVSTNEIKAARIKDTTPVINFNTGENVIITEGPFENFIGIIKDIEQEKQKAKVELQIFGRNTLIEFNFTQLEKL
jgi:transcriptional antiterminator NusG